MVYVARVIRDSVGGFVLASHSLRGAKKEAREHGYYWIEDEDGNVWTRDPAGGNWVVY